MNSTDADATRRRNLIGDIPADDKKKGVPVDTDDDADIAEDDEDDELPEDDEG